MVLYIEFDNRQLTFRTNLEDVRDYVATSFRHMLVPTVTTSAGELTFSRSDAGYTLATAASHEFTEASLDVLLPLVKDEVRLQFMRGRPDLLWIHAGVTERSGKAVLLAGTSGQGKSTLSTHLCDRGWRFLSDDVAPIRMDVNRVLPFLQSPVRRLHPGREVKREELSSLGREIVELKRESLCRTELEIQGIVFLEYQMDAPTLMTPLDQGSAAMEFLRNATNFFDHRGAAVERAARLVTTVPMYRLAYGSPGPAIELLDAIWQTD